MAAVAAAQPAVSYFPQIAPSADDETFASIFDKAKANFAQYDDLNTKAGEVAPLAAEWGTRNTALIAGTADPMPSSGELQIEMQTKLDVYIKYRKVREDSLQIAKLYDAAIAQYVPPVVTEDVRAFLTTVQRSGVDLTDLKSRFDKVFTTDVDLLKDQRDKMSAVYNKIVPELQTLCAALEQMVRHVKGYNGGLSNLAYAGLLVTGTSTTPLVKAMVNAREKELAKST